MLNLKKLTVEYRTEPLGVESRAPRFGWQTEASAYGYRQKSCRIRVASAPELLENADCWDSGRMVSGRSDNIEYAGKALAPATEYFVRVDVIGENGETASADTRFETALYSENFTAEWIAQPRPRAGWSPYLRRAFSLKEKPAEARLYFCGLGYGEAWLNGARVTADVLEPIQTNFEKQISYTAYDVTDCLTAGENVLGAVLGCGFYNQDRVWCDGTLYYGGMKLLCELHITYPDGSRELVLSDTDWQTDYSPITLNNVYGGETYDARLDQPGWAAPGFDAAGWVNAIKADAPGGEMVCRQLPPIRKTRRVFPVSVRHLHQNGSMDQTWIADMGQNFAGWAKIRLPYSPAGAEVVLRFAERLDSGSLDFTTCGTFHTCLLQQDRYIAKGASETEIFEPRFTYHGFRYIEITGLNLQSTELPKDFLEVWAVNTDLQSAGHFRTEYDPVNRLQTIGLRTVLSNYHGIPEDCPVREKCGWLGDAQLVSETAIQNFDMAVSYEKYLEDIRTSREVYGDWQMIAPGKRTCGGATPLWGCAQVVIPWNLYLYYNDTRVLRRCYPLMQAWIEHEQARSTDWIISEGLGDWCPPGGHDNPERIPVAFSSSAEFYHVTVLTGKVARVLGLAEDEKRYADLAEQIRAGVNARFLDESVPTYGTMGADGVALAFGLCPEELRGAIAEDCLRILQERCGGGLHTGIYGNKYMIPAMTEMGYGNEMLAALFNPEKASFATMMNNDATSVWECFDDSEGFENFFGGESSMNHPMQFAFSSWFYTHILGIRPAEDDPAYRRFTVRPYMFGRLREITGVRETPYGQISVGWRNDYDVFTLRLVVPANTEAVCELPPVRGHSAENPGSVEFITDNGGTLTVPIDWRDGRLCFTLGSGSYRVVCR